MAAMAFTTACSDLTPVDYSEINPNNFPKNESDVEALVMDCYRPLRGDWWDGIYSPSERGVMFINDCTTGILTGDFGAQRWLQSLISSLQAKKSLGFISPETPQVIVVDTSIK